MSSQSGKRISFGALTVAIVLVVATASGVAPGHWSAAAHALSVPQVSGTLTPWAYLPIMENGIDLRPPPVAGCNYSDDFSNPASGWPTAGEYGYVNGEYDVHVYEVGGVDRGLRLINKHTWCDNVRIDVNYQLVYPISVGFQRWVGWGVVFRYVDDANYYTFELAYNGTNLFYQIGKTVKGTSTALTAAYYLAASPDNQVDTLTVIAEGSKISVAQNGRYLATVSDPDLSAGYTGFESVVQAGGALHVLFDNFSQTSPASGWLSMMHQNFDVPPPWPTLWSSGSNTNGYYWGPSNCRVLPGRTYSGWAVADNLNGGLLPCGSNYPDNTSSWIVYGPFSLANASAADMHFKVWLNTDPSPPPMRDGMCEAASTDGTYFYFATCLWGSTDNAWVDARPLDLAAVPTLGNLMGQPKVWIGLWFISDGSINYPEGAYIDDITLHECVSSYCPATVQAGGANQHPHLIVGSGEAIGNASVTRK